MRKLQTILAVLCVATFVTGCGKKEEPAPGGGGAAPASSAKKKVSFVSNNAANFWSFARAGCNAAATELGDVDVDFRITQDGSSAAQRQILDDLVAKGIDGIAVSVNDPDNQTDFLNKIADSTLLVCCDSDAAKSKRVAYIGTDNEAAGEQAGAMIKECLPNGGKIMLFVGHSDSQNAVERSGGIKKALEGSNIEIVDIRTDDTDPVRAQKNAEDTLVKYPDIACLVGLWNYNGPAILNAVRGAGKTGAVKIVCFDDEDDTLSGIAAGDIYGTVVQNPFEFGKQSVTRMDKYLHGDKSQLDGKMFIPTRNIKKDSVADYQAYKKKILEQ
ncbi:MAG TPA: sugar-binding protein [Candidatus Sulfotelmatobacter sp.]|jgi:ribose transport system substrate-binding protein|nr:sugar-binding protein [Candidatus Sulfotelmatobacter sp.]